MMRTRPLRYVMIAAALALPACAKKSDGCRLHAGDGLCADPGKDPKGNPQP